MEFTLLGAAAVAVGSFWLMLRWEAKRGNAAGCALDLWDVGLTAGAVGLLAGRLISMTQAGISPFTDPKQIILIRSGVSTAGASVAALLAFGFLARKSLLETADALAPSVLAGLAGWHAGTLITGSWLGTVSDLPWARPVPGRDFTRHPVELYAAGLYLIAAIAIALWKQKGHPPLGVPAGLALAGAAGVRLITEPMRISLSGGPLWLYAGGVVAGLGLVVWAVVSSKRSTVNREP
ncbi:MAG: prolipoprotein diacylglyceryl transferase family protein [Acidimicrobiia bacterium]